MADPTHISAILGTAMQELQMPGNPANTRESVESYPQAFRNEERFAIRFDEVFADFATLGDPQLAAMLAASREFCHAMSFGNRPPYWLSLLGTSGAGKTMLMRRIARFYSRFLDGKVDEQRTTLHERWLRKGGMLEWNRCVDRMVNERDYGFLRQTADDWFLAIDDIGAEHERHREISVSKLYQIFSQREGKWLIVTANLGVEAISNLDARVGSRLLRHGAVVVDVDVPDFNLPGRREFTLIKA